MLKLTIRSSGVFIVNFEQLSIIILVFPMLTLNKLMPAAIFPKKYKDLFKVNNE